MNRIIFLGDSITDAHHNLGVDPLSLGDGYVQLIAQKLKSTDPGIRVLNRGHDGFTLQGVLRFLGRDCILQKPDVVSILVGCNDVGVMMNTGKDLTDQGFAENYERLLTEIQEETGARIVCMGPFLFPYPLEYQNWIPGILQAEQIIHEVARRHHQLFIPLHEEMQEAAERYGYDALTTDGIHLTRKGAGIVADRWIIEVK